MTRREKLTASLATLALVGFAANSLLCRAALGARAIDAASFTAIRMASGALVLAAIVLARRAFSAEPPADTRGTWPSAIALFAYALAFSLAYRRLSAATGALVLFAAVQVTMTGTSVARGYRPRVLEWLGIALATGGLVALVAPGLAAPDPIGALLMALAGASWGVYSLRGRAAVDPLATTAANFVRTLPLVGITLAIALATSLHANATGVALAIASGALASGVGYSLWYAALPALAPSVAAVIQLGVPVITAAAAVVLLDESLSVRFVLASAAVVGGIMLAIVSRPRS